MTQRNSLLQRNTALSKTTKARPTWVLSRHVTLSLPKGHSPRVYLAEADLTDDSISRLRIAFIRDW